MMIIMILIIVLVLTTVLITIIIIIITVSIFGLGSPPSMFRQGSLLGPVCRDGSIHLQCSKSTAPQPMLCFAIISYHTVLYIFYIYNIYIHTHYIIILHYALCFFGALALGSPISCLNP